VSRIRQKDIVTISLLLALAACSGANTETARSNEPSSRAALAASAGDLHGSQLPDNRTGAGMAVALENKTTERDLQQRLIALEQSLIEQSAALERLRTIREEPDAGRRTRTLIEENQRILRGAMQPPAGQIAAADAETPAQRVRYENVLAAFEAANRADSPVMRTFEAYRAGRMTPEDAATFEQEVRAGNIMLPRGARFLDGTPAISETVVRAAGAPRTVPQGVLDAYAQNRMTQDERNLFERHVRDGVIQLPDGFQLNQSPPQRVPGAQTAPPSATDGPTVAAAQAARLQSELNLLELERRAAASRAGGPSTEQVQSLERRAIELEAALRRFGRI